MRRASWPHRPVPEFAMRPTLITLLLATSAAATSDITPVMDDDPRQDAYCAQLDAGRHADRLAMLTQQYDDLATRTDADSLSTLALLQVLWATQATWTAKQGEPGHLADDERELLQRIGEDGGLASFNALWPRRDALAWSQLYPLFLHQRARLDADDRQRWHDYLVQRGGDSLHAYTLRLLALQDDPAHDPAEVDALLGEAAARARIGEETLYDLTRRGVPVLLRVPTPASLRRIDTRCDSGDEDSEYSAEALAAAQATTAQFLLSMQLHLTPLNPFCGRQLNPDPARATACRDLGRLLARGADTVAERMHGTRVWQRFAIDADDAAEAESRQRQLHWWLEQSFPAWLAAVGAIEPNRSVDDLQLQAMLKPGATEIGTLRAVLSEAGYDEVPPQGWLPAWLRGNNAIADDGR